MGSHSHNLSAKHSNVLISGKSPTDSLDVSLSGSVHGSTSMVTMIGTHNGQKLHGEIVHNALAGIVHVNVSEGPLKKYVVLSDITNPNTMHLTVISDGGRPEVFAISAAEITKSKSLRKSVLGNRGEELVALVGEQSYDKTHSDLDSIFSGDAHYERFLEETDAVTSEHACFSNWCIPFYCIPIVGILTYAVKKCR